MSEYGHKIKLYTGEEYQYDALDEVIDGLLELAPDEERKEDIKELMTYGHIDDFNPRTGLQRERDNFDILRRITNSYLMVNNPDTFDYIKNNGIRVFHGTNSIALNGILSSGYIKPIIKLEEEGKIVETGEKSTRFKGLPRSYISFTDVLDVAEDYSTLYTNDKVFPVVIGITLDTISKLPHSPGKSDLPEVSISAEIPLSDISIIMVPSEEIDYVSSIVPEHIKVLGMDNLDYRFFYFDHPAPIEAPMQNFDELKEKLENARLSK